MVALHRGQRALLARQHLAPVAFQNLHRAIGPAEALALIAGETVGRQAKAKTAVHVDGLPAADHQAQAHLRILANAPFGPVADLVHRFAADQRHGAVLDDRVALVALHHADVEEAGIFPVDHFLEGVAAPVVMVLRRLHEADFLAVEIRRQAFQPVRFDQVIGIDHADDL